MVLAQLVEHVALVDEEHSHPQAEEQHHPLHLHAHADEHVDARRRHHTDPSRAAVAEEQTSAEQREKQQCECPLPAFPASAKDKVDRCGDKQCYGTTVGRVVVVEGAHHAVEGLQVAEVAQRLGSGDKNDDAEADGVCPVELGDALTVAKYLHGSEVERYDEPQT